MAEQDIAGIIKDIQSNVRTIVKGELELMKSELVPQAKTAGVGAGLLGAAAYLAITAITLLFLALAFLLSLGFVTWFGLSLFAGAAWGFLITAVLLLLVGGLLALVARKQMVFSKPERSINQAEQTGQALSTAVKSALAEANSLSLTGSPKRPELP
ncbi:MAG: phage holin family protein [Actinobacteria bacterium]|nr:phage holin family protein [Actinomycetota bacterium]